MQALRRKLTPLHHAEAVLLVDHHKRQCAEGDLFLHERMRADDEVDLASRNRRQQRAPCRCAYPSAQQRHAVPRALKDARDRPVVLFRQNFGGGHERDLSPALDGHHCRQQGYDGLARTDIPLQQALHRPRALLVGHDLAQGVALSGRERKRQHRARGGACLVGDHNRLCLANLQIAVPPQRQSGLEDKELFEHQPALGRRREGIEVVDAGRGVGKMCRPKGRGAPRPLLPVPEVFRDRVEQGIGQQLQGLPDKPSLHVAADSADAFVDRHDSPGVQGHWTGVRSGRHGLNDLELRIGQLQATRAPEFRTPEQHQLLMWTDHIFQKCLIRPDHLNLAAGILY